MRSRYAVLLLASALSLGVVRDVFAHATPIEYDPTPAIVLERLPEKVVIRFTERVEPGASSILIYAPDGQLVPTEKAHVRPDDAHYYEVPIPPGAEGTYAVSWQVISADDGHFTKGAFTFSLGKIGGVNLVSTQQSLNVVHQSSMGEILSTAVELLGHSLLWGFLLIIVALGGLLRENDTFYRRSVFFIVFAFLIIVGGALAYIGVKTLALANVQQLELRAAFDSFMTTVAGKYALYRIGLGAMFLLVFLVGRKAIKRKEKTTRWEYLLLIILLLLAAARVRSSHGVAALVLPYVSIFDHYAHNIAKSIWAGGIIASLALIVPLLRKNVASYVDACRRLAPTLAVALGVTLVTGVYIIWLDLKDFGNLFVTDWGKRFVIFSILLLPLIALRLYHMWVIDRKAHPKGLAFFSVTGILEALFALALIFGTAASMVTTPPVSHAALFREVQRAGDISISLEEHPYEKNELLLSVKDNSGDFAPVEALSVTLYHSENRIGPLVAETQRRSDGSFVISKNGFAPPGTWHIKATASRRGQYDVVGAFELSYPRDLNDARANTNTITLNSFTVTALAGAAGALLFGIFLVFIARQTKRRYSKEVSSKGAVPEEMRFPAKLSIAGVVLFLLYTVSTSVATGGVLLSDFEKQCRQNGDFWHVMTPMRYGRIVSQNAYAGCMTKDGAFHFPDVKEYTFFTKAVHARVAVTFDPPVPTPKVETRINFDIKDDKGEGVGNLITSHERLLHVIILSDDFSTFSHIHPEDFAPIDPAAKARGHFSLPYTFPKAGTYLVALDYQVNAHHFSEYYKINTSGEVTVVPAENSLRRLDVFDGHTVALMSHPNTIRAKEKTTLEYLFFEDDGTPITALTGYLGAAMHLAIVKEDLSQFIHTHGEVHTPGSAPAPAGSHLHNAALPHNFGPEVESHVTFPEAGIYHIFGEFKHEGRVVQSHFVVKVD